MPALAAGVIAARLVPDLSAVTTVNALSFVGVGLLVAAAIALPLAVTVALGLLLGLGLGYANGAAMEADSAVHLFVLGVAAMGTIGVTLLAALVVSLEREWQRIAVRVVGSWIAAIGLMMLALRWAAPTG